MSKEVKIPKELEGLKAYFVRSLLGKESKAWEKKFYASILEGADLSLVWPKFVVHMLDDDESGVIRIICTHSLHHVAKKILLLFQQWVSNEVRPGKKYFELLDEEAFDTQFSMCSCKKTHSYSPSVSTAFLAINHTVRPDVSVVAVISNVIVANGIVSNSCDGDFNTRIKSSINHFSEKLIELLKEANQ